MPLAFGRWLNLDGQITPQAIRSVKSGKVAANARNLRSNKEPAMSEYKEFQTGDLVVCTDDGLEAKYLTIKKITGFIDDWGLVLNDGEHWVEKNRFRRAEPEEIAAGHRIDCETLDKPENHISPNCKVEDV